VLGERQAGSRALRQLLARLLTRNPSLLVPSMFSTITRSELKRLKKLIDKTEEPYMEVILKLER
jgi:hypothetical protein